MESPQASSLYNPERNPLSIPKGSSKATLYRSLQGAHESSRPKLKLLHPEPPALPIGPKVVPFWDYLIEF